MLFGWKYEQHYLIAAGGTVDEAREILLGQINTMAVPIAVRKELSYTVYRTTPDVVSPFAIISTVASLKCVAVK